MEQDGIEGILFGGELYFNAQNLVNTMERIAHNFANETGEATGALLLHELAMALVDMGNDIIQTPGCPDLANFMTAESLNAHGEAAEAANGLREMFEESL